MSQTIRCIAFFVLLISYPFTTYFFSCFKQPHYHCCIIFVYNYLNIYNQGHQFSTLEPI